MPPAPIEARICARTHIRPTSPRHQKGAPAPPPCLPPCLPPWTPCWPPLSPRLALASALPALPAVPPLPPPLQHRLALASALPALPPHPPGVGRPIVLRLPVPEHPVCPDDLSRHTPDCHEARSLVHAPFCVRPTGSPLSAERLALAVELEAGKQRVFAAALDWPGFCRSGRDETAAFAELPFYARATRVPSTDTCAASVLRGASMQSRSQSAFPEARAPTLACPVSRPLSMRSR